MYVYTFKSTIPPCLWSWSKIPASQTQAKCKSRKPILSEVKVFWYLGVDFRRWPIWTHLRLMMCVFDFWCMYPYVHITTSMWGHCEEHVKQCEEHVRWVWGTSEDNVRGSVRNMWGVGNLTTLILSVIANVMPVSNRNHQTSLIKEWLSDVW